MLLSIDPGAILWTVVNLLVLYALLRRFLFGPVNAMLESRARSIADAIADADDRNAQAGRLKADYEAQLANARIEAARIVSDAKARGQREYQTILDGARADAGKLLADTRVQLEAERRAMLRAAQRQVAALALLAAAKVTQREMDAESDRALVSAFLSEAGELK